MADNTIEANRNRFDFDSSLPIWLFGYGSLIFKADFPYIAKKPASIQNWERRFWQGSHDHRGTESSPGRVVTLVESVGAICHGMAYQIDIDCLEHLDYREKNGYLRFLTELKFDNQSNSQGLVYIATESNRAYLGPVSDKQIALQILSSSGPSGTNIEYFNHLYEALKEMSVCDSHMQNIQKHIQEITK